MDLYSLFLHLYTKIYIECRMYCITFSYCEHLEIIFTIIIIYYYYYCGKHYYCHCYCAAITIIAAVIKSLSYLIITIIHTNLFLSLSISY